MNSKKAWFPIAVVGVALAAGAAWVTSMAMPAEQQSAGQSAHLTSPDLARYGLVPDGDLNLASQRDRDTLHARTRQAADSACGRADVMSGLQVRAEAACRDLVFADADMREQSIDSFWNAWHAEVGGVAAR